MPDEVKDLMDHSRVISQTNSRNDFLFKQKDKNLESPSGFSLKN